MIWVILLFVIVIAAGTDEELRMRRDAKRWAKEDAKRAFKEALSVPVEPDPDVRAWTPQEREVLGVNDTIELISRIDKELGTEYAEVKMTPAEHVYITNQEAS